MIGAGAMGLLFAAKCAPVASKIQLVTRTTQQEELLTLNGIKIGERCESSPIHYTSFAEQKLNGQGVGTEARIDWIFLFVKQQHIDDDLIRYITYWTDQGVPLLCFQNGIGHIERLARSIPVRQIFTAVTTEAAFKQSEYEVRHTGTGETWIGHEESQYALSEHEEKKLLNMLNRAGFVVYSSKNMKSIVWRKLLINAVINPLTAILKISNGELLSSDHWKQVMRTLYAEGRVVANSLGITLPPDLWEQLVAVCQATASNHSSMLQDILDARMTEIEWINGAMIRLAEQKQLSVPAHKVMYQLMKGIESSTSLSSSS